MKFKKLGFRYRIIQLREFTHPIKIDGIGADLAGYNCFAAATGEPVLTRHIAAVEIKNWLFKSGVTFLYGEAAKELVKEAKEQGVYIKADPGKNQYDRKVSQAPVYSTSASGYDWYWYANTGTSSTTAWATTSTGGW